MNLQLTAIKKINSLPDSLLQEVNDFIDFLVIKYNIQTSQINPNTENIAESDMSDYLQNLENHETAFVEGKLKW